MSFTQVAITGKVTLSNSTAAAGASVTLTLSTPITDGTQIVAPEPITARCANDGTFSITVNANDDLTTLPLGTYYNVSITYGTQILDSFNVIVPHADAPTVNLFTLATLPNPSVASPYVSQLVAGTGVTLSPAGGTGAVTVSSSGGGISTSTPVAELPSAILDGAGITNAAIDPRIAVVSPAAALTIPTGFSGNDVVEPSILWDPTAPFLGFEYVLCAAPFFQSNAALENPCLWVSTDGNTWIPVVNGVPTVGGTVTPLVPNAVQGDGNLSDPYLVQAPDGTYYVYWNQFLNATPGGTGVGGNSWAVKMIHATSLAGPWSTPVNVIATVITTSRPTSPSVFWDGASDLWHMYALEFQNTSATFITHYTATNPAGPWAKLTNPTIALPTGFTTQEWWHLNAYKLGSQHVLLVDDSPKAAESNPGNLWLLTSIDRGVTWTVPSAPLLTTAQVNAYRSTMIPTRLGFGDGFDLFYGSGESPWALHRSTIRFPDPDAIAAATAAATASIPATQKGAFNGVATLDGSGQVPLSELGNAPGGGGTGGPPTGSAGGALGGTYPNPTLSPTLVQAFRANAGALTTGTNNQVAVTFPTAMPDASYTVQVTFEDTLNRTTDTTVTRHVYNRTATGFTAIVNPSNTYTSGQGLLHVLAIHDTAV